MKILFSIAFITGMCIGLFNPLFSIRLEQLGVSESMIGFNTTVYFVCIGLLGILSPRFLLGREFRSVLTFGLFLCCVGAVWFLLMPTLTTSFMARAILGAGLGLYMTSMQSAVLQSAGEGQYGKISAIYAVCFGTGMGIGPVVATSFYGADGTRPLMFGIAILIAGLIITVNGLKKSSAISAEADEPVASPLKSNQNWKAITLQGAFAYGAVEAVVLTIYPVYWVKTGLQLDSLGPALALIIVGGLVFTPLTGWLADRWGTKKILFLIALCSLPAIGLLTVLQSDFWLLFAAFATGATVGPIFAISLALIGEANNHNERVAGASGFTVAFSAGCIAGPLLSAWTMDYIGEQYIFVVCQAALLVFMINILMISKDRVSQPA